MISVVCSLSWGRKRTKTEAEQECIPVECVPPGHRHRAHGHGPPDTNPHGQRHPLGRDTPLAEIPPMCCDIGQDVKMTYFLE